MSPLFNPSPRTQKRSHWPRPDDLATSFDFHIQLSRIQQRSWLTGQPISIVNSVTQFCPTMPVNCHSRTEPRAQCVSRGVLTVCTMCNSLFMIIPRVSIVVVHVPIILFVRPGRGTGRTQGGYITRARDPQMSAGVLLPGRPPKAETRLYLNSCGRNQGSE